MGWAKKMRKELLQLQMQQIRDANKPNPYIEQLMGINKGIIDWHTNPNNTVKDIYKHPTLGGKLPIFQFAKNLRDAGRIGRGIAGVGDKLNTAYTEDKKMEDEFNRDIAAKGMLETGLTGEFDKAQSDMLGLVMGDTQRRTSSNSIMGGMSQQLNQMASNGWGSFFKGIIGGLAPMGMSMLTGGLMGGGGSGSASGSAGASMSVPSGHG